MGCLECDRRGCENIMCNRFCHEYGYICDDCYSELVGSKMSIGEFMDTPKNRPKHDFDYSKFEIV